MTTNGNSEQRVLVVDDEADIVALVAYHLAKSGYGVATASNGAAALEKARRERPALVVLDLMLPDMSGFDVLESPTAICPIIVHDTARAIAMSHKLLEMGVYVIGFGYPVVPEGHARLRVQISAAHEKAHIDKLVDSLRKLKATM